MLGCWLFLVQKASLHGPGDISGTEVSLVLYYIYGLLTPNFVSPQNFDSRSLRR